MCDDFWVKKKCIFSISPLSLNLSLVLLLLLLKLCTFMVVEKKVQDSWRPKKKLCRPIFVEECVPQTISVRMQIWLF